MNFDSLNLHNPIDFVEDIVHSKKWSIKLGKLFKITFLKFDLELFIQNVAPNFFANLMKLLRYRENNTIKPGILDITDQIRDISSIIKK